MRDLETVIAKAVPRLGKGDAKAAKRRAKVARRIGALWNGGPKKVEALGVAVGDHRPVQGDGDALLEAVRAQLGDREFARLLRRVWKDLTRKREAEASRSDRLRAAKRDSGGDPGARRRKRRSSPSEAAPALTLSSHDEPSGEAELAIPDDDELPLAIPDDDVPLAVPDDELGVPDEGELVIELASGPSAPAAPARGRSAPAPAGGSPAQQAEAALAAFRRTGDGEDLARARKSFRAAAGEAVSPIAKGAARGGLALTSLLAGDAERAAKEAKAALGHFPAEPNAVAVACRARWPHEGERERLAALLRRCDAAFDRDDDGALDAATAALAQAFPSEPFAPLVALARALQARDGVEAALGQAWERYPASLPFADLPLGAALEPTLIKGCLAWLAGEVESSGELLGRTVKDVEGKGNHHAGAFQIALGLTRVALAARPPRSDGERQRWLTWVGHGLFAAQHYDAANDVYGRARAVDRNGDLLPEINKSATQCGVMKRAFDRPGVKARRGGFEDVGSRRARKALAGRLQTVLAEVEAQGGKARQARRRVIEAVLADPKRRAALQKRAKKAGLDDPFAEVEALDAEAAALEAPEAPPAKGGGLFGRMKAGMTKAIDKAKSAAKGAVVASKRGQALEALAGRLSRAPDGGWGDDELDAVLAKAARLEPRLDFLDEAAAELRAAAARAAEV